MIVEKNCTCQSNIRMLAESLFLNLFGELKAQFFRVAIFNVVQQGVYSAGSFSKARSWIILQFENGRKEVGSCLTA
jgi:hypothetical protein